MALENKLGLTSSADLAREEERISKKKAVQLYESGRLDQLTPGTVPALQEIHRILFEEIYDFAGKIRTVALERQGISMLAEEDARCEYNDILYLAISADSMTLARDMLQL